MCLPACFVREGVEDAEGGWPELKTEPRRRGRLLLDERETGFEKRRDLRFLACLCLETNKQRYVDHSAFPFREVPHAISGPDNRQGSRNIIVLAGRLLASCEPTLANGRPRLGIDGLHHVPGAILLTNDKIYLDIENVRFETSNARLG